MKKLFGDEVSFNVARPRKNLLQRLGAPGAGDLLAALEERALYARFRP
jgi:hypothetical protein